MRERYVLLGLARARSDWFRTVGRWSTAAMLPAEFVRCVSSQELRARLRSGRAFSAVLVDGSLPGVDRDLIAEAGELGVAVLVVDTETTRDWRELGAAAVLAEAFSRDELLEILKATSSPVGTALLAPDRDGELPGGEPGGLVAVTGPGGTGASTVAIALAQGLAAEADDQAARPGVLLADLCRAADQAMLHDARILVPSIQELVEAHRTGKPSSPAVVDQTFDVPARGYRVLLGLRRPRHWVALRPRALEQTLDSLQRAFDVVVADVEADVEGEAETGSADVEDRNRLSRTVLARAEVVLVVAGPGMQGLYAAVRTLNELLAFGVAPDRLLPVIARGPRSPRARAELTAGMSGLVGAGAPVGEVVLANPLHLPDRPVDQALRDGVALPSSMARSLARATEAIRARAEAPAPADQQLLTRIAPGSFSSFTAQEHPGS
ncbi:MAG: hypothetical protein WD638_04720 [Nitriliruptoraceae bacterium]